MYCGVCKDNCEERCNGNSRNYVSRFGAGAMRPMHWKKREFVSKNQWGETLSWALLQKSVENAIGAMFAV